MVSQGFAKAGYMSLHMDDCWEQKSPARDPTTHRLRADPVRFPTGMAGLGEYVHAKNLSYSIYTAESTETCGGYPASQGYELVDAQTFADWKVRVCTRVLFAWLPRRCRTCSRAMSATSSARRSSRRSACCCRATR